METLSMSYKFYDEFRANLKAYEYELTEDGITFMGILISTYFGKDGDPDFKLTVCERTL